MLNRDELKGKLRSIKGRVKEALAEAAADDRAADEGRVDQAAGESRAAVGAIKQRLQRRGRLPDAAAEQARRRKTR